MVARFQSSAASSSATATLKLVRSRSFILRTACRRSLIDCAASMCSSSVRKAMGIPFSAPGSQLSAAARTEKPRTENSFLRHNFRCDALGSKGLDHIAGFDVAIICDRDAAFHAVGDFFGIVLEAAERSNLAFEHDDAVPQQAHFGVAFDQAIEHSTSGDGS